MKKLRKNDKGFTLVELIVVLVILALLAAILVPALLGYIDKAKKEKNYQAAQEVHTAVQALATESYGKGDKTPTIKFEDIKSLAGIDDLSKVVVVFKSSSTDTKVNFQVSSMSVQFSSDSAATYYTYQKNADGKYTWEATQEPTKAGGGDATDVLTLPAK